MDKDVGEYHLDQDEKVIKYRRKAKNKRSQTYPECEYRTALEEVPQVPYVLPIINVVLVNIDVSLHLPGHCK